MPRDVIISIKPEWVGKIISGEKTIELRKNFPNQPTPFRCFIYVTKDFKANKPYNYKVWASFGKVIGECDVVDDLMPFVGDNYPSYSYSQSGNDCLTFEQRKSYLGGKIGHGWLLRWVEVYDTPRPLSDFYLARAPQSWCYVPYYKKYDHSPTEQVGR